MQKEVTRAARRATLAMARSYQVGRSSLRVYYWSLAQGLRALEKGYSDADDLDPFTCYQGLEFDPDLQQRFKEVWGREIGQAAGLVTSLAEELKNSLKEGN
jgi:hypothetical protein